MVINPQATKNIMSDGKNPESPVMMGRASMPAPIQLPAMSKMPPMKVPVDFIIYLRSIAFSSDRSGFLDQVFRVDILHSRQI